MYIFARIAHFNNIIDISKSETQLHSRLRSFKSNFKPKVKRISECKDSGWKWIKTLLNTYKIDTMGKTETFSPSLPLTRRKFGDFI